MKHSYLAYLLTITFTSNVYAGSFDIKIGKITLPDEYVIRPGTPTTFRGTTIYSFMNNKDFKLATTNLGVIIFNYKKKSPEIADESDKNAAVSCLKDTITAMNKSYPTQVIQPYSESKIGNHFAMEALILSKLSNIKLFGDIRCMKFKDYLVTITMIEKKQYTSLSMLGKKVSEIKLYK